MCGPFWSNTVYATLQLLWPVPPPPLSPPQRPQPAVDPPPLVTPARTLQPLHYDERAQLFGGRACVESLAVCSNASITFSFVWLSDGVAVVVVTRRHL
ncbi:hypothetical protein O3P69_010235 [Scylla paramamosain]|uniref:Secreted protein n=1 Tax=Scylla paramamosain TaxID=85552 RepID=A0AAW0TRJ5_SCYPA